MNTPTCTNDLDALRSQTSLWYRLHVFTFDLRHFRENIDSAARLDRIVDASYLGSPYFSDAEVAQLKATTVDGGSTTFEKFIEDTLEERLNRRMKKRTESNDYRVCAAHDLAPIFELVFDIKPKELAKNSEFVTFVDTNGLENGETWPGLEKTPNRAQSNQKNKKKKGKH